MEMTTLEPRQERALDIVKSKGKRIKHVAGNTWLVPSQTNASGGYLS
jgi:hypothetical protein